MGTKNTLTPFPIYPKPFELLGFFRQQTNRLNVRLFIPQKFVRLNTVVEHWKLKVYSPQATKISTSWFFVNLEGYKSYSRSKPLTIEEFDLEKKWWNNRKQTEHAWKITIKEIKDRNYNLDFKNPHIVEVEYGDPDKLMKEYEELSKKIIKTRDALKNELIKALGGGK